MSEIPDKRQPIRATLARLRTQLQNEWSHLERNLNTRQHILASIRSHPWEWASCASILGWRLSRMPARKKRIYIHSSSRKPIKSRDIGPEGKLWREVWNISKPMIAAYFAKLLEENAKTPETRLRNESLK
jgi:hypothetical protein